MTVVRRRGPRFARGWTWYRVERVVSPNELATRSNELVFAEYKGRLVHPNTRGRLAVHRIPSASATPRELRRFAKALEYEIGVGRFVERLGDEFQVVLDTNGYYHVGWRPEFRKAIRRLERRLAYEMEGR